MFIKLYLITFSVFFAIDMFWLGLIAKSFYSKYIGFLMRADVNWIAALIFYLLFIVGLVFFVISPSLENRSIVQVVVYGALFGLISYATYDLTNLATIKDWPIIVTVVDMIWGTVLASIVSLISYLIAKRLGL